MNNENKIKIDCGDHTIELTPREIRSVYEYRDIEYYIEDIRSHVEDMDITEEEMAAAKESADVIAERAMIYLDKSDGYWDHYWSNIEAAIIDVLRESK